MLIGDIYFWSLYSIDLWALLLCQDHTILITIAVSYSLKPGSEMLLFSSFPGLLWAFYDIIENFRIIYFISVKTTFGILIELY